MNYHTDLNLGEVVYISIIFHIPVSWPNLLNMVTIFIFDGVTLQTSHILFSGNLIRRFALSAAMSEGMEELRKENESLRKVIKMYKVRTL